VPCSWFEKISQRSKRGTPDILGVVAGEMIAMELKRSGFEKPDPLQQFFLERIAAAGGIAILAYPENWPATLAFIKKLADKGESGKVDPHH
jgi:hypothetical protein